MTMTRTGTTRTTSSPVPPKRYVSSVSDTVQLLQQSVEAVLLGKREVVNQVLIGLLAGGHLLIEDVPGVGKTTLARALASSIDVSFRRIQFTPDLLPSDILGVSIFHTQRSEFEFKPGPIFASVVLADEINRTTPRTQSALLEAMNERQVTVDGVTHPLPAPFMVLATQNPYEYEGTYPLPESQLDRFLMRIRIGYPSLESEQEMIHSRKTEDPLDAVRPVIKRDAVTRLQAEIREVRIEDSVSRYLLEIVRATRETERTEVGASPRAALGLTRAAQARAAIEGRDFVIPDDIKRLAVPVLAHRIIRRAGFHDQGAGSAEAIIEDLLESVSVPV